MSSEQSKLVDLSGSTETPNAEPERNAATMADVDLDAMRETNHCLDCGARLTERVARLVGDNDGNVPQCEECTEWPSTVVAAHRGRTRDDGRRRP